MSEASEIAVERALAPELSRFGGCVRALALVVTFPYENRRDRCYCGFCVRSVSGGRAWRALAISVTMCLPSYSLRSRMSCRVKDGLRSRSDGNLCPRTTRRPCGHADPPPEVPSAATADIGSLSISSAFATAGIHQRKMIQHWRQTRRNAV